jgi:hypothetical protein
MHVDMQATSILNGYIVMDKYYCTGQALTISMVDIKANSAEEAEAVMNKFIDKISTIMTDEVRWDESDWSIEENILNEKTREWLSTEWIITNDGTTIRTR